MPNMQLTWFMHTKLIKVDSNYSIHYTQGQYSRYSLLSLWSLPSLAFECNYVRANPRRRRLPSPNHIPATGQSSKRLDMNSKYWNTHYGPAKFVRKCVFPPRGHDVHCAMPVVRTRVYAFNCVKQISDPKS